MSPLCSAMTPLVQKILPLFEAASSAAETKIATAPLASLDLVPIAGSLVELKTQHSNLREEVVEQNATLKRTEDKLQMVREATERNTLEQRRGY